jgi:hypothetical protein
VWKFESDATLGDALDGRLGEFPACLEEFMLGKVNPNLSAEKRDAQVRGVGVIRVVVCSRVIGPASRVEGCAGVRVPGF